MIAIGSRRRNCGVGSEGEAFAPITPLTGELAESTEKMIEKVAENDGKWRFFEGPKRHLAVARADRTRLQHARLPDLTFTECGGLAQRLARQVEPPEIAYR